MSSNATLCRMCAEIVHNAINIYDSDYDNVQYISKFKQLFSDIVFEEDYSLPEHICSNCCTKLKDASNFKKQCISSMEYLKKCNTNFDECKPENSNFEVVNVKKEDLNELLTENTSENIECDTSTDFVILRNCTKTENVENYQELRNKFAEIQKDNNTNSENREKSSRREEMKKLHCSVLKLKDLYPRVHVPNLLHSLDLDPFVLLTPLTNHNLFYNYHSEKINNDNKFVTTRAFNKVTNHGTNAVHIIEERINEVRERDKLKDKGTELENAEAQVQNSEEIHTCFVCQKGFRFHSDLETHVTVHLKHSDENVIEFSGDIVNEEKIEIKEELTESNEETISAIDKPNIQVRYNCRECDKHYSWKHDLKKHVMCVHKNMKPYSCNKCQKKFGKKHHLDQHIHVHGDVKPYTCNQCQKQFTQKSTLYEHTKVIHRGVKPHSCKECHKQFGRKSDLKRHSMEVHRGMRPYSCNVCQKKFGQKSSLKVHMITHTDVKPYNCKECQKQFCRKNSLTQHMIHVHNVVVVVH